MQYQDQQSQPYDRTSNTKKKHLKNQLYLLEEPVIEPVN